MLNRLLADCSEQQLARQLWNPRLLFSVDFDALVAARLTFLLVGTLTSVLTDALYSRFDVLGEGIVFRGVAVTAQSGRKWVAPDSVASRG